MSRVGFDMLSPFYRPLKKLALANSPEKAIEHSISHIRKGRSALIVGGGNDNLLVLLAQNRLFDRVDFVDISKAMTASMKKRFEQETTNPAVVVNFIRSDFLSFDSGQRYDAVFFPFFLDILSENSLKQAIEKTRLLIHSDSAVYLIDFNPVNRSIRQRAVLLAMHLFFQPIARMNRFSLPDFDHYFGNALFDRVQNRTFCNDTCMLRVYHPARITASATSAN